MAKLKLASEFPKVSQSEWLSQAEAGLSSGNIDRLISVTNDGIAIQPIYPTPEKSLSELSFKTGQWKIVQRTDIPDLIVANSQILDDLLNGATGISLVLPGSVTAGSYGAPAYSVDDLKRLLQGVELDLINVRLDAGPQGRYAGQNLLQVYQDRNLDLSRCDLTLALDPVSSFAISGSIARHEDLAGRMVAVLDQARNGGHKSVIFSGDGRIYHESGAGQALELGFAIAGIVQHLHLLEQGGADLSKVWPHLGLMLSADADQFLTIAKLRAAHLVWQHLQETMDVDPTPLQLDVETSLRMMSKRDPYVNMLRTSTATFAAGIGGASSVSVLPFTCAIGVPDEFARRMARNTQTILQEESSIGLVGDAAAGSGYVEAATGQIAEKAWQVLQQVSSEGGMLNALAKGLVQKIIADSTSKTDTEIANRQRSFVGVSEFANLEEIQIKTLDFRSAVKPDISDKTDQICEPILPARLSAPFESLRDQAEAMITPPVVHLATLGTQTDFAARATWISNLLAAGGIRTTDDHQSATIACICSSDEIYNEKAEAAARQLKSNGFEFVLLAGKPKEMTEKLQLAEVDKFIYAGCDVLALLQEILSALAEGKNP